LGKIVKIKISEEKEIIKKKDEKFVKKKVENKLKMN
jgi:hypothetical protein